MLRIALLRIVQRAEKSPDLERGVERPHLLHMRAGRDRVAEPAVAGGDEGVLGLVHAGEMHEGFYRLAILAGGEMGLAEVAPETLRVVRVEPHRLADPFHPSSGRPSQVSSSPCCTTTRS